MPCAKIKGHRIEEGLESCCLVRLTPSHAWRSKEKNRDLVLGRNNQNSLAHRQSWMICKVVFGERHRGQELGKPRTMWDKKDLVGETVEKAFPYENSYVWGTCNYPNLIPVSCIWFHTLTDKQKFVACLTVQCPVGPGHKSWWGFIGK